MIKSSRRLTLVAILLWPLGVSVASTQIVRVPGTRVSLEPPDGFSLAQQFPGFEHLSAQASIMVTELPGPASAMRQGMTKAALASRGMTLLSSRAVVVNRTQASLLQVRQMAPSGDVLKWMLIAGDQNVTIMIVGAFPTRAAAEVSEPIKRSLLSAIIGAAGSKDPFEGLTFRVAPTPMLRIAGRVSNMLVLSETGSLTPADPDAAFYVIGHSFSASKIQDLRSFAETRVKQTAHTVEVRNLAGRPLTLDGLDAYELQADATDTSSGRVMKVYQVIGADADGYFIIQAFISARRSAEVLPEFKRVTASFRRSGQ